MAIDDGILGAIVGGGMDLIGNAQQNADNMQSAQKAMEFSNQQAEKQMAFQERMSSTAYQRQAEDMKKAGLNPINAFGGGASTPSGAQGSAFTYQARKLTEGVGSSAKEFAMLKSQMDNINANTESTKAEAKKKGKEMEVADATIKNVNAQREATEANSFDARWSAQFAKDHPEEYAIGRGIDLGLSYAQKLMNVVRGSGGTSTVNQNTTTTTDSNGNTVIKNGEGKVIKTIENTSSKKGTGTTKTTKIGGRH